MPILLPERYAEVLDRFDGGGMSEALLCKDANLDRPVVVKALRSGVEPRRMLDEINALSRIRSKYVVQLYDVIRDSRGNVIAVVEEYIPGPDLFECEAPENLEEAIRLLYPIAAGISDIHAHDGVHRDIKPNNMKFDGEGCLKIFDFGLAKLESGSASTGTFAFTEGYAAPELFKRKRGVIQFTKAVDTYAFGATAFELLNGELPDDLCATPPSLPCAEADFASLEVGLPEELSSILGDCLEADPDDRPAMATVRDLLAKYLLKDRHRALLTYQGKSNTIDASKPEVRLRAGSLGAIVINYDGHEFKIAHLEGAVYVNNRPASVGFVMPGACIIVVGEPALGTQRANDHL